MEHTVVIGTQKVVPTKENQRIRRTRPRVDEKQQEVLCGGRVVAQVEVEL